MNNGEEPAYPHHLVIESEFGSGKSLFSGLSKRELIAAMAMQGILEHPDSGGQPYSDICKRSVICADELLKQLSTTTNTKGE